MQRRGSRWIAYCRRHRLHISSGHCGLVLCACKVGNTIKDGSARSWSHKQRCRGADQASIVSKMSCGRAHQTAHRWFSTEKSRGSTESQHEGSSPLGSHCLMFVFRGQGCIQTAGCTHKYIPCWRTGTRTARPRWARGKSQSRRAAGAEQCRGSARSDRHSQLHQEMSHGTHRDTATPVWLKYSAKAWLPTRGWP
jgi:hypothetical protein